jgi:hypothetical protein
VAAPFELVLTSDEDDLFLPPAGGKPPLDFPEMIRGAAGAGASTGAKNSGEPLVECPVCCQPVPESCINAHLDEDCLK